MTETVNWTIFLQIPDDDRKNQTAYHGRNKSQPMRWTANRRSPRRYANMKRFLVAVCVVILANHVATG
jgi:hypothetical protein